MTHLYGCDITLTVPLQQKFEGCRSLTFAEEISDNQFSSPLSLSAFPNWIECLQGVKLILLLTWTTCHPVDILIFFISYGTFDLLLFVTENLSDHPKGRETVLGVLLKTKRDNTSAILVAFTKKYLCGQGNTLLIKLFYQN